MYIQNQFEESRTEVLNRLIREYALATFIVCLHDEIVVNHFPLVMSDDGSAFGVLKGHIPRANCVWEAFDGESPAVAVFQGPSAYITPGWYPSKHLHGKVVPTWNYAVVHAHGTPVLVEDPDWLLDHLNALTDQQESTQSHLWEVSDAPADYTAAMLRQLVGVEMRVTRLEGKWKVSQNRSEADRQGVAAGLLSQGDDSALAMEALVRQR